MTKTKAVVTATKSPHWHRLIPEGNGGGFSQLLVRAAGSGGDFVVGDEVTVTISHTK